MRFLSSRLQNHDDPIQWLYLKALYSISRPLFFMGLGYIIVHSRAQLLLFVMFTQHKKGQPTAAPKIYKLIRSYTIGWNYLCRSILHYVFQANTGYFEWEWFMILSFKPKWKAFLFYFCTSFLCLWSEARTTNSQKLNP